jgi:hypothetical protein
MSTFAATNLTTGIYAMVVYGGVDSSSSQSVRWRNDTTSPPYTGGSRVYSITASSAWTADASRDYIFEQGDQK